MAERHFSPLIQRFRAASCASQSNTPRVAADPKMAEIWCNLYQNVRHAIIDRLRFRGAYQLRESRSILKAQCQR